MTRQELVYGPPYQLAGRSVLVVGAARSGTAAARLAVREGARVMLTDRRADVDLGDLTGIETRLGEHRRSDFESADLIVVSPGVPRDLPELAAAEAAGVPVLGELELAWSFLTDVPCIAITGTNGKSTTTALVGHVLEVAGRRPFTGGNIGRPLSEAALVDERPGMLAVEVSSFQLESVRHFHPRVAVVLNITPDHLDRHGDLETYAAIKQRIFANLDANDHAVVNADDPVVARLADETSARVRTFAFGAQPGGGCGIEEGRVVFDAPDGAVERYRVESPSLRGPHNLANAAAAILACRMVEVPPSAVQRALDGFEGLPHRLELVRTRRGVEWINDSKATNIDSAATALRSFGRGVVLIAGGRGKGVSYDSLREPAAGRLKAVLGIGEDGTAIVEALADCARGVSEYLETLEAAVTRAEALTSPGDVVLLSPACASYDQFDDYGQRGMRFRTLVEALA